MTSTLRKLSALALYLCRNLDENRKPACKRYRLTMDSFRYFKEQKLSQTERFGQTCQFCTSKFCHHYDKTSQLALGEAIWRGTATLYLSETRYIFGILVMKRIENQTFEHFTDWVSGKVFSDIEFINCSFVGCGFSMIDIVNFDDLDLVALRSVARNLSFTNCDVRGCYVKPGIVEDVLIDGLKLKNHVQTAGTVFKHVTIKGMIDLLMLTPYVDFSGRFPNVQGSFDEANREYYKNVDWALDISEAQFKDCDIRAIPSRLIRRDPKTQAILTREKALEGKWKDVDLSGTHWSLSIEWLIEHGYEDKILVAPKKGRNFKVLLEGLYRLRDAGVVDLE